MPYNINNANILYYYPLDTNLADQTGSRTFTGTITTVTTKLTSGSLQYNNFIDLLSPKSISDPFGRGLTFAIWVKYNTTTFSNNTNVLNLSSSGNTFQLTYSTTGYLNFEMYGPRSNGQLGNWSVSSFYLLPDTNWHHYCIKFGPNDSNFYIYVDGVQRYATSGYTWNETLVRPSTLLNQGGNGTSLLGSDTAVGYANQFVVFDRALTLVELSYLVSYPSVTITNASSGFVYRLGSVPTINTITPASFSSLNVNFTKSTGGDLPITYYYSTNGGTTYKSTTTTEPPIVITDLSMGTTYNIKLIANNPAGNTAASDTSTASIPFPDPPTITDAVPNASSRNFSVVFTPGSSSTIVYGSPITYYYSLDGGSNYTNANKSNSPITTTSLIDFNVNYNIKIIANYSWGNSAVSNTVVKSMPDPLPPTINNIVPNASSMRVVINFTPGINSPTVYGSPITYYYSLDGGSNYTNANKSDSPITSLVDFNVNYNIKIIANYSWGNSAPSNMKVGFVPYPCFLQGSKILRLDPETDIESYVPIETLKPGDLIRTSQNGHKAIFYIGKKTLPNPENDPNPKNRLYRFSKSKIPEMREDLCVTGEHCILYKTLSPDLKRQVEDHMGEIYITEDCYRVPACLDKRAIPYKGDGPVTIWHFALESKNVYNNYGVYANGLLVESCSIQYLTEYANMELV